MVVVTLHYSMQISYMLRLISLKKYFLCCSLKMFLKYFKKYILCFLFKKIFPVFSISRKAILVIKESAKKNKHFDC